MDPAKKTKASYWSASNEEKIVQSPWEVLKTQPQFQYYLDNQAEMLQMIEGTVISSEEGRNYKQKAKTGGRAKLVMEQSINVSGAFMTKLFSQREEDGEALRLDDSSGPFSSPFFVGMIAAHRREALRKIGLAKRGGVRKPHRRLRIM